MYLNYFQARNTVENIVKRTKCVAKHKTDMRYQAEWLLESVLLRIKSRSAYDHLRREKLLPLPCPKRLSELIAAMSCHWGFDEFSLDAIEAQLAGKELKEQVGAVLWDEIVVDEQIYMNRRSFMFHGFVDSHAFACGKDDEDGAYIHFSLKLIVCIKN